MNTARALAPFALSLGLATLLTGCPGNDEPVCGDATCETGENATDCPADCGCGNGAVNAGEACDGDDLDGATCESEGLGAGTLACTAACELDTSGCGVIGCGDGVRAGTEACDGADLGGAGCASEGFSGGALACAANCTLDTTGCCDHACPVEGDTSCGGEVIQTCVLAGDCRTLSDGTDCAATGEFCDDTAEPAVCSITCVDECPVPLATQCSGTIIQSCVVGPDGCTNLLDGADCALAGYVCYDFTGTAECLPPCTDDCAAAGDTRCTGDVIDTCTAGPDGCLDWVAGTSCAATGEACDDTAGAALCVCVDDCAPALATQCTGLDIERCDVSADGCLGWVFDSTCGGGGTTCTDTPVGAVCTPVGLGEDCANPYPVVAGVNAVSWSASTLDYLTAAPSCITGSMKNSVLGRFTKAPPEFTYLSAERITPMDAGKDPASVTNSRLMMRPEGPR